MAHAGRRVALLSIDASSMRHEGFRTFNYGVRRVQAALVAEPTLSEAEVHVFDFGAPDAERVVEAVERVDADVIGASCYVWSFPAFHAAARELKRRRPERTIVFGGPSARPAMLDLPPFREAPCVDALVTGDGERAFCDVVRASDRGAESLRRIGGLAVPAREGWERTADAPIDDLDSLPSLFQLGLAPEEVTGHLETYRGCPLRCAFCEWGVLTRPGRVFSRDYLVRELRAMARSKLDGALLVDAGLNLNARAFENLAAAEREVGFFRDHWFSCEYYAMHTKDAHLEFLSSVKVHSVGVGLQSYNEDVLRRLSRPYDADRFDDGLRRLGEVAPYTLEIIVGLPHDNPDSFRRTLDRARAFGHSIIVYHCLVLPDGLMTRAPPGSDMVFDPHTLKMISCTGWSARDLAGVRDTLDALCQEMGTPYGHDWWNVAPASASGERGAVARDPWLPPALRTTHDEAVRNGLVRRPRPADA